MCASKRKALRNLNPQGLRFPKFVRFGETGMLGVVMRKRELDVGGGGMLQRYVVPEKYLVQTRYVHWRRTKRSKLYLLANRTVLKTSLSSHPSPTNSPSGISHLDLAFVASIRHIRSCLVSKDYRLSPEVESILGIVLGLVEKHGLNPGEVLEELVFPIVISQDGGLYVLLSVRGKVVTDLDESLFCVPKKKANIEEFLSSNHIQEKINSMSLPFLSLSEIAESTRTFYHQQVCPQKSVQPVVCDPHISGYLNEVVSKLDRLRSESSMLKKEFGVVRKIDFSGYPDKFVDRVVTRTYDAVLRDSRLLKYYERIINRKKMENGVKKAVVSGTSHYLRLGLRKIHSRMGITDADFDLYMRHFLDAMKGEEAREDEIRGIRLFLEDIRRDVVIPIHAGAEERPE